ncbi:MAG TPA: GNAT family N-acetyltransferase [Candidatus Binatia bacterium]|nr:GNAT family N-acetyltransferase [Candidatus Binatia bacterium]
MPYRLIPAVPADEQWLETLRRSAYEQLFQATWGAWDEARHRRHFSECIKRGHISIIEADGVRVGMLQLFDERGAVEIGEIQVAPSHQNRGIGTRVLLEVIADAHRRSKPVRLRVGLKNEHAFRLYQRLGFRHVALSDTHHHLQCAQGAVHDGLIKSAQAAKAPPKPIEEKRESDFYNVPENRLKVFERDGYLCYRCGKHLTRFSATLDHIQPVSRGGDHSYANLVTSCLHCNSRRGNGRLWIHSRMMRHRRSNSARAADAPRDPRG